MGLPQRFHGMIATSGSWRRFWLEWRWSKYPWVKP